MINYPEKAVYTYDDLVDILRILRAPGGCPWDREQTHESNRRNFLEEAYEAAEAIDREDPALLKEELGDLLLQVVFHADIERQAGDFTIDDVADGEVRKMLFRHPHVFGGQETVQDADTVLEGWEAIKRREKGQRSTADAVEAVPHTLPALWRAEKIQSKTAKAGFDWTSSLQALDKLEEEVRELRAALEALSPEERGLVFGRVMEGRSYEELSGIYGKSAATLRKRYERARKKLARLLTQEQAEERKAT